ncbi:uncharacterized protein KY384_000280 [Bacidia gigantensis]|uniref:uncharacterized protein n=1 Tax=Bacidia gigantensis TaxID=2732470 RepID=UPI001D04AEEA|nr:uncharacterized protein KY384_000280 [Bacidia gigantensis]KAG8526287.1 hypothetical protein KY384_000280 [Bacidia gigantensis]
MSSIFSQHLSGQQNTGTGLFGSTDTTQNKSNLFGSLNTNNTTQQGGGLFGSTTSQPAQTGGLFGSTPSQPAQGGGLFGSTTSQPAAGGGLFGSTSQPQQGGGLFGSTQPAKTGSGIFGQPQVQQGLFGSLGSTAYQPPPQGSGIFRSFGQPAQQAQQTQQQGSVLGQPQSQSRLFQDSQIAPRQKSVTDQIELAYAKWNPQSPHTPFQTYLYNAVAPESAPFYGPGPQDDEVKWEEALAKKPSPGAVPVAARGFEELSFRMKSQYQNLNVLQGRLHEINEGLNALLQKHDLDLSIRTAECKRKHLVLSRQCLSLAAKTQMLRNRGYAMDAAEEELRKKLLLLERTAFDPALSGKGEEIWARMVSVRERGRQLQQVYEKAGRGLTEAKSGGIDEEVMKRAKKILEDYNSQLEHLTKELASIEKDWKEYEQQEKPTRFLLNGR